MSVMVLAFPVVMVRGYGFQYSADLCFLRVGVFGRVGMLGVIICFVWCILV